MTNLETVRKPILERTNSIELTRIFGVLSKRLNFIFDQAVQVGLTPEVRRAMVNRASMISNRRTAIVKAITGNK